VVARAVKVVPEGDWRWRVYAAVRDALDLAARTCWWLLGCPCRFADKDVALTDLANSLLPGAEVRRWREEDAPGGPGDVVQVVRGRRWLTVLVRDRDRRRGRPADVEAVEQCVAHLR
jgi:hypothetical protein